MLHSTKEELGRLSNPNKAEIMANNGKTQLECYLKGSHIQLSYRGVEQIV